MNKVFFSAVALAAAASVYAVPEISVSSNPALPAANLIKQSDFTDGKLQGWTANKVAPELVSVEDSAIKLTGDPAKSPNAYYRLRLPDGFKKGVPYYVSFRSKRSGSGSKANSGSTALAFDPIGSGKSAYTQVPDQPKYDYDWVTFSQHGKVPQDSKLGTFYLCFYQQEGSVWFDDIVVKYGTVDLNISVKGGGLQMITVRNSVTGTVLKEKISGAEYNKTLTVPAFGSYSVEVLDRTGEVTSTLYPADEDANVAASDTVVPVAPIKRIIAEPGASENFVFALPDVRGKKVYLQFRARGSREKAGPGGYAYFLTLKVNGKGLGVANVVKPGKTVSLKGSPKKVVNIANKNGFIVFFCNAFMDIPEDNGYFPLTYQDNNPWNFKLDITNVIESDGLNVLDMQNVNKNATLFMEDLQVVIE